MLIIVIMTFDRLMFEAILPGSSASPLDNIISSPQRGKHQEQLFRAHLRNQPHVLSEHYKV
jgi:hypothetical protein